jgi:hypothetical protein
VRFSACLAAAVMVAVSPVRAQPGVQLSTQVSARRVEVGDTFRLQLTALVESEAASPASPRLGAPSGIDVQGPTVSTQRQVSIAGGRIEQRIGITATWTLRGTRPGTFVLGPASVSIAGKRVSGEQVTVEIVPAGSSRPRGRRGRGWPFDPFDPFGPLDPFGGFPRGPPLPGFGLDDEPSEEDLIDNLPAYPDELRCDRVTDSTAFLRATIEPSAAVIGQQVTFRVFAYGRRGPFREANTSEASRPDFVSHRILEDSYGQRLYRVPIQNEVWHAVKIREVALFPIRAGQLPIGAMRMGFEGRGYPSRGRHQGLVRYSPALEVTVSEPPATGRPLGYRLGDVGRFKLTASVQPRELAAGEATSVVATLQGSGNFPFALQTPQQHGVEWLQPNVVDQIDFSDSRASGWRKFTYVVRLEQPGRIELGEITLPYWDPWSKAYQVARTGLGMVEVRPGSGGPQVRAPEPSDPLDTIAAPRVGLGAAVAPPWRPADSPWFWGVLSTGPALVLGARGGVGLARAARRRWRARQSAHQTRAARALGQARQSAAAGDVAATASAAERALLISIEGAVGLKARAVLRDELPSRLEGAGLGGPLSEQIVRLLQAFDAVRFTGAAGGLSATELLGRTRELVARLRRFSKSARPKPEA